ncbi:MAG: type II secretion system minor pseudopilin GspJ [Gammaproteobacteria bacterium]|nr:type II secretion system minor pseudopilin GspJ [Gammaproteobacteria bacterium]MCW5583399.1 type II secretion system minor pseudopilin GspJ [Gammaproteobacteria bacterium]
MRNKSVISIAAKGFTLLEVLIALFIFTILSMILVTALHSVIQSQAGTENKAGRLRQLQITLLIMARDIEQTVNRPVLNHLGKEEAAFVGAPRKFAFTHTGFANPIGTFARSTLQRTGYIWNEAVLSRMTWPVLDQAPQTQAHNRRLLTNVSDAHFQYLGEDGRFYDHWPLEGGGNQPLPRAIRVYLSIPHWGKLSQLYVIPVQGSKTTIDAAKPSVPPSGAAG